MLYSNLSEAIHYASFVQSICKQSGNGVMKWYFIFGCLELFFERLSPNSKLQYINQQNKSNDTHLELFFFF